MTVEFHSGLFMIAFTRVTVEFSRDARGRASLCVTGKGHNDEALRALGEQLSQRVVQQYVYQKLMDEMRAVLRKETGEQYRSGHNASV